MQKFNEIEYKRPDFDALKKDYMAQVENLRNSTSVEEQKEAINVINKLANEYDTVVNLAFIRNSIDTRDEFYDKEKTFFDEKNPEFFDCQAEYYKALSSSKFRKELAAEFGEHLFTIAEMEVKSFSKENIDLMKEENKLGSEYSKLVASAKIDFRGETLNLSQLSPFAQDKDRATRKEAAEARYKFVAENGEKFDEIYDKAVKVRHQKAKNMGFDNYVKLGYLEMKRFDYTPEMVANFRKQVQELIVPLVTRLQERQAKRIGVDSMKHYDSPFKFKSGNPTPKGSPDWIVENGQKMYRELSTETGEFFDKMIDYNLMDLVTKPGKDMGGYCTSLVDYKMPYIFSNFNGTSGDIDVLTHEAGHAFQVYSSMHYSIPEYYWPTYESCEIHSMSMEFFTWPWMGLFFKEDTEKYKFGHLAGSLSFLPYGVAVDEFQHVIYENPEMTPTERRAAWREIEKKYQPNLDWDGLEYPENGGRWQLQSHIYQRPFYYIDYCLAQICAFQFWVRMQDDFKGAWADYHKLCKVGGSMPFVELVKYAGLKSPFEDGTVESVVGAINNWLDKTDDAEF
ncbi:MAG: M3 family oligoendopeptidase [Chitinophagales bacterium]